MAQFIQKMTKLRHFFIKINNYLISLNSLISPFNSSFFFKFLPSISHYFFFHFNFNLLTDKIIQMCKRNSDCSQQKYIKSQKQECFKVVKWQDESNQIRFCQIRLIFSESRPFQSYPIWHHQNCHIRYSQNLSQSKRSTQNPFFFFTHET